MFFQTALALFALAMIAMTFSPNATVMVVAQGLAGFTAAALVPTLVVLIATHYLVSSRRRRWLGGCKERRQPHTEERYAGIARAVGGEPAGSTPAARPGKAAISNDGRGGAGPDDDRSAARGRGDRLCPRGRRARLSPLHRRFAWHRAREHRPDGRALLRRDAADAAGLGLRPQLRRAGPPTCLPDTGRSGPETGEGDDVVSRGGAAGDSSRFRERGLRAATRAVPGRGEYAARQADRRPARLCAGTRVRAGDDAGRPCQHPAAQRPADAATGVRAVAT